MTDKVNGYLHQGAWYERDTSIVEVTVDAGDFLDTTIGADSWKIMEIMQTRGTVIGYTAVSATVANFMFGHAAGAWGVTMPVNGPDVIAELEAAIIAGTAATSAALVEFEGFAGATPGTTVPGDRPAV